MSLRLTIAARAEVLADRLAASLARPAADSFARRGVWVPSPGLRHWLQRRLVRAPGSVLFGVEFDYIENGLRQALTETVPALRALANPVVHAEGLRPPIAALLAGPWPETAGDDAAPLRDYLGPPDHPERWQRAAALAERLAGLFLEYESHLPGLVRAWLADDAVPEPAGPVWRAERALYRALFGPGGFWQRHFAGAATLPGTLPQLADRHAEALDAPPPTGAPAPEPLRIFGLSHASPRHVELLARLARGREVELYLLAYAPELWRDPSRPAAERWRDAVRAAKAPEASADAPEPWRLWGTAGRRFLGLLDSEHRRWRGKGLTPELLDDPADAGMASGDALPPLLVRAQAALTGHGAIPGPQDASVQIVAAPGVRREVEAVAASIRQNLRDDPTLRPSDIGVLTTDMATYLPALRAVLARGGGNAAERAAAIPCHVTDADARGLSLYMAAAEALLDAAEGRWTRAEVFRLLDNPCVRAAAGIGLAEARQWREWVERLGVFRALDARDKADRLGMAPEAAGGAFTWREGLMRLRLGRILSRGEGAFPEPAADVDLSDGAAIGRFSRWLESLADWVGADGPAGSARRAPSAWASWLKRGLERFVRIPDGMAAEAAVAERLGAALRRLDETSSWYAEAGALAMPLAGLRAELAGGVGELPATYGSPLGGGVAVASLRPMRPVPFRIVYVMGLGEGGGFPGIDEPSTLDLRGVGGPFIPPAAERPGDPSAPERNRYLFMETCMGAREKLILSYVSRDLARDREYHPAGPALQWERWLERYLLHTASGRPAAFYRVVLPVAPWSEAYLAWQPGYQPGPSAPEPFRSGLVHPLARPVPPSDKDFAFDPARAAAVTEAMATDDAHDRALCLRLLLRRAGSPFSEDALSGEASAAPLLRDLSPAWREFVQEHREALRAWCAAMVPTPSASAGPAEALSADSSPGIVRVTIRELREFLRDPEAVYRRRHLRLGDPGDDDLPDDPETVPSEPFRSVFPQKHRFDVEPIETALLDATRLPEGADGPPPEAAAAACLRSLYAMGTRRREVPEAIFGVVDEDIFATRAAKRLGAKAAKDFIAARRRAAAGGAFARAWRGACLGPAPEGETTELRLPAPRLDVPVAGGARRVEVVGRIPLLWLDDQGAHALTVTSAKKRWPARFVLDAWLFGLAVRASLRDFPETVPSHNRAGDGPEAEARRLAGWLGACPWIVGGSWSNTFQADTARFFPGDDPERSGDEAEQTLTRLLSALFDATRYDRLPLELVEQVRFPVDPFASGVEAVVTGETRAAYAAQLAEAERRGHAPSRSGAWSWGELAPARIPSDAFDLVRQRLGPVFVALAAGGHAGRDMD